MYTTPYLKFEDETFGEDSLIKLFTIEEITEFNNSNEFEEYKNLLVMKDKLNFKKSKESESPMIHLVQILCMMILITGIGTVIGHPEMFIVLSMCASVIYPVVGLFIGIYKINDAERTENLIDSSIKELRDKNKIMEHIEDYLMVVKDKTSLAHELCVYKDFFSKLSNYDNVNIYYSTVNLPFKEHTYDVMFKNILFEELKTGTYFTIAYNLSDSVTNAKITKLSIFEVDINTFELEQKV